MDRFYLCGFLILILTFSSLSVMSQKSKDSSIVFADSIWTAFSQAALNKDLDYLSKNSMDSITCVDCNIGPDRKYYSAESVYQNDSSKLNQMVTYLANKDYSSYMEGSEIKIMYNIKSKYAEEGREGWLFTFKKIENEYKFTGMLSIP